MGCLYLKFEKENDLKLIERQHTNNNPLRQSKLEMSIKNLYDLKPQINQETPNKSNIEEINKLIQSLAYKLINVNRLILKILILMKQINFKLILKIRILFFLVKMKLKRKIHF